MANQFGIEYDSIAEVKAVEDQQLEKMTQQAVQRQDPVALTMANRRRAISQIFSTPEERKAKQTDAVMREAASLERDKGESEFAYQTRQAELIRSKAAQINPEVAMQANEQILAIRNAELQRDKLVIGNEARTLDLEEAKHVAMMSKQGWIFERQEDGELRPLDQLSEGQPDAEDLAVFEAMRKDNPNLVLGSGMDVLKIENLLTSRNRGVGLNKSSVDRHLQGLTAAGGFARDIVNLGTTLSEDVGSLGLGRDAIGGVSGLNTTVDRFKAAMLEGVHEDDRDEFEAHANSVIDDVFSGGHTLTGDTALKLSQATSTAKSQVKAMAYKLAKALDPGGRLSDQDVEMAIEMVIGSGDPVVIERLITERLYSTYEDISLSLRLAQSGKLLGDDGRAEAERVLAVKQEAIDAIGDMSLAIQEAKKPGRIGIEREPTSRATPKTGTMTRAEKIAAARAKAQGNQ